MNASRIPGELIPELPDFEDPMANAPLEETRSSPEPLSTALVNGNGPPSSRSVNYPTTRAPEDGKDFVSCRLLIVHSVGAGRGDSPKQADPRSPLELLSNDSKLIGIGEVEHYLRNNAPDIPRQGNHALNVSSPHLT